MKTVFFNGQEIGQGKTWDDVRLAIAKFGNDHVFDLFPLVQQKDRLDVFCRLYRHPVEKSFTASDVAVETATSFQVWPCGLHQAHKLMEQVVDLERD